jgi:hypothetical protein
MIIMRDKTKKFSFEKNDEDFFSIILLHLEQNITGFMPLKKLVL